MGHFHEAEALHEALMNALEESAMYDDCLTHQDRMRTVTQVSTEFDHSWKNRGEPVHRYFLEDGDTGFIINDGRDMTEKEVEESNAYFRSMRLPLNWHPCLP